jgi:hypothetical protein
VRPMDRWALDYWAAGVAVYWRLSSCWRWGQQCPGHCGTGRRSSQPPTSHHRTAPLHCPARPAVGCDPDEMHARLLRISWPAGLAFPCIALCSQGGRAPGASTIDRSTRTCRWPSDAQQGREAKPALQQPCTNGSDWSGPPLLDDDACTASSSPGTPPIKPRAAASHRRRHSPGLGANPLALPSALCRPGAHTHHHGVPTRGFSRIQAIIAIRHRKCTH